MALFSKTSEYALRAAICLADHCDEPLPTHRLAELTQIPPGYLSKVLQLMSRGGLVSSLRGMHGGFTLTRLPDQITVLDVLCVVDPMPRIQACPLNDGPHTQDPCPLQRQMNEVLETVRRVFSGATLADLLTEHAASSQCVCRRISFTSMNLTAVKEKRR